MTRRRRADPRSVVPRLTWVVGELEVSAPADWTAERVIAAARSAPVAVRAPTPRSVAFYQKDMETIAGHRWCGCYYAAWREDAPHPAFEFRPDPIRKEDLEQFVRGRRTARRVFPHRLARVPDEPIVDRGALFVRPDAQAVRLSTTYAPWWPLTLEQEEDPERGIIRVSMRSEVVAYMMPLRVEVRA
jgi:hypothetical protein